MKYTFAVGDSASLVKAFSPAEVERFAEISTDTNPIHLDEEYARLQGISVLATNILALSLVALTVVALIRVVGLILVIALLTLPAATAGQFTRRFGGLILTTVVLCILLTTVPRIAVYGTRISPESAIVLAAAGVYLVSLGVRAVVRRR